MVANNYAQANPDAPDMQAGARTSLRDIIAVLVEHDDENFTEDLLRLTRADELGPHIAILWDSRILARLCACADTWFTSTILTLAQPDYAGLTILFDERLLARLAALPPAHLRGTFLPYARRLSGFDARDFLATLRECTATRQAALHVTGCPLIVSMETIETTPVTWLWWPYIALGKLTMLDGDPGIGKSLLMTQLAASLSRGNPLPDQEGRPTLPTGSGHTTLLLSSEDGLADTLKPRLEEAGADCGQIKVMTGWVDGNGGDHPFTLAHLPILEQALETHKPRLVVIDPIQAYLGRGVDMHRANETRPLLEALRRLAEEYACAIVCVRHPAKSSQGGKAMHRGLGSVDFIGAARTGLFVEQHPSDPGKVLLAQSKSNIGPLGRTQIFTKYEGHFQWCGVSRLSAELLAGSGRGPDPYAFLEAVCWLEARLKDGSPVSSEKLSQEAIEEGLALSALRRAKKALGIRSLKCGEHWDWCLPALAPIPLPSPFVSLAALAPLEPLEHLHTDQRVSGTTSADADSPSGPETAHEPPNEEDAKECQSAQPVANVEDVQEAQVAQEAEETTGETDDATDGPTGAYTPNFTLICGMCGGIAGRDGHGNIYCIRCGPPR
jgi:hypothetical protein